MKNKFKLFLVLLILVSIKSFGQSDEILKKFKADFPDETVICLNDISHTDIKFENGKWVITTNHHEERLLLNSNGSLANEDKVVYSDLVKLVKINAFTKYPKGKGYKKIDVTEFIDGNYSRGSIFYDDNRYKSFIYPSLVEGAVTVLDHTLELNDPHFYGSHFLGGGIYTDFAQYSVTFPKGISIGYKLFGTDTSRFEFKKEEKKNSTTYTWTLKKSPKHLLKKACLLC